MTEPDPLAELRDQVRAATDAAGRLARGVRIGRDEQPPPARPRSAPTPPRAPPAGWQQSDDAGAPADLAALARLLEALREILPAELRDQLTDLVRQVLIALRALIDWVVVGLEEDGRGRAVEVEDIRVD